MEPYITIVVAFAISLVASLISGVFIIPILVKKKMGQTILEIGPKWHKSKQGIPVMGGLLFILGVLAAMIPLAFRFISEGEYGFLVVLFLALSCGLIGALDDYEKIAKKQNLGLTPRQKLALQIAVTAVFLALLRHMGYVTSEFYIPFTNYTLTVHWTIYYAVSIIGILGVINAANLTDGVDGLATGVTIPIALFFGAAAYLFGQEYLHISALAAALVGGLVGFLYYNFNPARIFMGDTGSLFLGGMVAGMAFVLDIPLILPVAAFVYVVETLSVTLQVGYFKLTGGKRLFKMAPIHHHFEMCGWKERKIFFVFSFVSLLMSALAMAGILPKL